MQAIVLEKPGQFEQVEIDAPASPGPGQVLVRVGRMGICGTDLHAYQGNQTFFTYPRILGHELGVEVVEVGAEVSNVQPGDRCAVEPYLNCGKCVACRAGKTNCCESLECLGVHVDGGMRSQILLPADKLHKSDKLELEQLALVEMLGIGCHAVDRANVQADETVMVIGTGPIGLGAILFARIAGAKVIALDIVEQRLTFSREMLGVEHTVTAGEDALKQIEQITHGDLPTAVFDCTGNQRSMCGSFDCVAHGGRLVFVGHMNGEITFHDPLFHKREMTLLASRNAQPAQFKRIIQLMEQGTIDTKPWITHRTAMDSVIGAFPAYTKPDSGVIKAMIEIT